MTEISYPDRASLPTTPQLLKASGAAVLIAGVLLITAVLPAEYGIDPTGIGEKIGLTAMRQADKPTDTSAEFVPIAASPLTAVWRSPTAYRNETRTLTLQPNQGAEIKALMKAGERYMFSWKAEGGVVSFDMHGDKLDAKKDEFTSYWIDRAKSESHGAFEAPFDGIHGWYWKNQGAKPVTITVQVAGYFEKLYRP
jgi:hypothetical protein